MKRETFSLWTLAIRRRSWSVCKPKGADCQTGFDVFLNSYMEEVNGLSASLCFMLSKEKVEAGLNNPITLQFYSTNCMRVCFQSVTAMVRQRSATSITQ